MLVCLVTPLYGQDSDQVTSSEPMDRERELKEWKREFVRGDVKRITKRTPDPFRRWSDGSVSYIGEVVWERSQEGYTPSPEDLEIQVVLGGFAVLEVSGVGAKVQTRTAGRCYVSGMTDFGIKTYSKNLMLKRTRDYTYKTVLGSVVRLPGFEYGVPITEEEYLRCLDHAVIPQPPDPKAATNAFEHKVAEQ